MKWSLTPFAKIFHAEHGWRIKPPNRSHPATIIECAIALSARERRKPCPKCGARQPENQN
jgi:hypothetical protein